MKILALALLLSAAALAAPAPRPEVQQLLTEAQSAFKRGDLETAKSNFKLVYEMDSRNQMAITYLRLIKVQEASRGQGTEKEKLLQAVIIPKIEFREATLGSAFDYLKKAVEKQTDGKQVVNFVVQLPAEQVNGQTITLNLTNVPFPEVLGYIGALAGVTFKYDKYAILVQSKTASPSAQVGADAKQ